jgi:hypothetical protein
VEDVKHVEDVEHVKEVEHVERVEHVEDVGLAPFPTLIEPFQFHTFVLVSKGWKK